MGGGGPATSPFFGGLWGGGGGYPRAAGRVAAPRAPDDLIEQLERALRRARVPRGEADVRVDHADQRETRELVPLGDELGADDHVDVAAFDRLDLASEPLHAAGLVARQLHGPRLGEELAHLLLDAFDPRANTHELVRAGAARGAGFGRRLLVPAMVALEALAEAVIDEPGRAARAFEAMPAGPAQGERRVAPAV